MSNLNNAPTKKDLIARAKTLGLEVNSKTSAEDIALLIAAAEDALKPKEEVSDKKKAKVEKRRASVEEMVREAVVALSKPTTHTGIFHLIFPDHPENKEAVMKWHDIGRALTKMVNAGEVQAQKVEGKRRTLFSKVNPE